MQLDLETAQTISNLALSLGLPLAKEQDLILALTGVDLVESSYEEAEKIWRDVQLPEESQSFLQDEDAIVWVHDEILPGIKTYINGRIQHSTIPYGYPLSEELLKSVYPNMATSSIQMITAGWETQRWNAVKYFALCEIWKLADTTREDYRQKGEGFCVTAERYISSLISALQQTMKDVPDNDAKGQYGLLVVKLPKNKRCSRNEYSN